jgi:hypothetical protein
MLPTHAANIAIVKQIISDATGAIISLVLLVNVLDLLDQQLVLDFVLARRVVVN